MARARRELLTAANAGTPGHCPCCDHWVQFYRRRFHGRVALDLLWLEHQRRKRGPEFVRITNRRLYGRLLAESTSDLGILKHWKLTEAMPNDDPKKKTSGRWRIGPKGIALIRGEIKIPEYVVLYLDTVQRFEGNEITFGQAIERPWFRYDELMHYSRSQWWDE